MFNSWAPNSSFTDGVTWLSNATVGGLIDGVDISSLADSIWKTENPDKFVLNVTGNGTFNILQSGVSNSSQTC